MDKLKNYLSWEDESEAKSVFSGPIWEHIKNTESKPRKYEYEDSVPVPFMPDKIDLAKMRMADEIDE